MKEEWYGVKSLIFHPHRKTRTGYLYEERVCIFLATSEDEAIKQGEQEAQAYAEANQAEYAQYVMSYRLVASQLTTGTEVFSLMRESELATDGYLDRFLDTGKERTR